MKNALAALLIGVAVLSAISSCATVPKEPLGPGELRLLSMEVPENGNLKLSILYRMTITFEADGKPEIRRACLVWPGEAARCLRVKNVEYGSEASFEVGLYALPDRNRLECYVEYIREGKVRRTNTVFSYVTGM